MGNAYLTWLIVGGGLVLMAASAAAVGVFALLRRRALVGDAIAHAVLPGVCLAFVVGGSKDPLSLVVGAFVFGYTAQVVVDWLPAHTRLKPDTALAVVLSVFFGLGVVLLTYIQGQGNAAQSGLDRFLFGQAAALTPNDVWVFGGFALGVALLVGWAYPGLKLLSFDPEYAQVRGLPVRGLRGLLASVTVLAVVLGIQAVGVVLLSALLITPAATARLWSYRLGTLIALAVGFAVVAVGAGVWVSAQWARMPTGPWVVVILTLFAVGSVLVAPRQGALARLLRQRRNGRRLVRENVLKYLYQHAERETRAPLPATVLHARIPQARAALPQLLRAGQLQVDAEGYRLSPSGAEVARGLVRRHRLWEVYLTRYLNLTPAQVHADAELVEHLLTPELERELETLMGRPTHDPHHSEIPY